MTSLQLSQNNTTSVSLVELLNNSQIITETDMNTLNECKEFIADTYKTVPMYRPLALKLFGVLDNANFPTPDMKFWQCKVEAETHAMELVRDIHDYELQKNQINRAEFTLKQIKIKFDEEQNPDLKTEISFDLREQELIISKKKFDMFQLEKKIKYRIEEVNEWKQIAQKLTESKDFKNQNYAQMLSDSLINKWKIKLKDPKISEPEKIMLSNQIKALEQLSNIKTQ